MYTSAPVAIDCLRVAAVTTEVPDPWGKFTKIRFPRGPEKRLWRNDNKRPNRQPAYGKQSFNLGARLPVPGSDASSACGSDFLERRLIALWCLNSGDFWTFAASFSQRLGQQGIGVRTPGSCSRILAVRRARQVLRECGLCI